MDTNNSRLTTCKISKYLILFLFFSSLVCFSVRANNIQLKGQMNVTAVTGGVATLEFTMSWDNSWRDNYNWDAAWVILKYQQANAANPVWKPIRLKKEGTTVSGGYSCQVNVTAVDTSGVLVHRSVKGGGTSAVQCSFQWPLPAELSGLTKEDFANNKVFFLVQGVEMVYVPYGPYYLGDGESVNTLREGYKRIIPAADDIIGTDPAYVYSMNMSHYKNAAPSSAADRVNNSVWIDVGSNISHISSANHGTASTVNNAWIVDFKAPKTIRTFGVSGGSGSVAIHAPAADWLFQGSNDNATWDTLWIGGAEYYTHDVTSYPVQHGIRVTKPGAYRYYRIFIPKINSTSGMMLANVAMSEKDLFSGADAPETSGVLKIIPASKDIIGTDPAYVYSMNMSHYKNCTPAAAADRTNNAVWNAMGSSMSHISSANHGTAATVNNAWMVDFKAPKTIRTFGVSGASGAEVIHAPAADWLFQGSNDNATWDTLWIGGAEYYTHDVTSYPVQHGIRVKKPGAYRYYRIFIPKIKSTSGMMLANIAMSEEDLFLFATNTYLVENEGKIAFGDGFSQLYAEDRTTWTGELPAAYPKGYKGFYVMKYEVSQEQYARFLNALTLAQQQSLIPGLAALKKGEFLFGSKTEPTNRNGIVVSVPSDGTSPVVFNHDLNKNGVFGEDGDGMCVACNFMNINDMLAYCAWAGLRPMSELEYEKASRRPYPDKPVGGEYAWNDAVYPVKLTGVSSGGMRLESAGAGNANFDNGIAGPVRCGVFATAASDQSAAGSTFWGVMEMSGNLKELCANVKHSAFDGAVHGKGDFALNLWGTAPVGFGLRGGGFAAAATALRTSDRSAVALADLAARDNSVGFRGVFCPDSGGVTVIAGTIAADNNLICSGSPVTLTGGEASLGDGAEASFRYLWYVKIGDGAFRLVPEGAGTEFRCEDAENTGSTRLKYIFKRKALCALGEAESNEVTVEVVNSAIRLSTDTIVIGVCGIAPVVEVAVTPGITARFDWVYNGNTVDTGRVYIPRPAILGNGAELYKYVVCKGNIGGCSRNVSVVVDYSRKETLFTNELATADCGQKVWDERDGQCYTTVNIPGTGGRPDQCWFSQNLNTGTVVPGADYNTHTTAGIQKICYDDKMDNCTKYGGLYRWEETVNGEKAGAVKYVSGLSGPVQGICPDGWHVPSDDEFKALEMNLGMTQAQADKTGAWRGTDQGTQMKMPGTFEGVNWCTGVDCNKSGFNGLPNGYRYYTGGTWGNLGAYAYWWSSTVYDATYSGCRQLSSGESRQYRNNSYRGYGFSVRCIKNLEVASTEVTLANCGQVMVKDTREAVSQYYNTVKIPGTDGRPDQCWFSNNMNIGTVVPGTNLNTHTTAGIQKICYDDKVDNCTKYGGLYRWEEAVNGEKTNAIKYVSGNSGDIQGICPDGWHVPSDNEFKALEMNLGMNPGVVDNMEFRGTDQAAQMKMPGTFNGVDWCTGADCNKSGFNGLPAGYSTEKGVFDRLSTYTYMWSSNSCSTGGLYRRLINTDARSFRYCSAYKAYGLSVRCIKNSGIVPPTVVTMENCGKVTVEDDREAVSQYYNTVKIPGTDGRPDQCWFSNNMNIGTVVPGTNYTTHATAGIQKICYGNKVENCTKYGGLYRWEEAVNGEKTNAIKYVSGNSGDIQGICPDGWHVPSDDEFKALEMNLGMSREEADKSNVLRGTDQGTQMKMPGTFEGTDWCTGADCNKSGFRGLPGGRREPTSGNFGYLALYTWWWSSTMYDATYAWERCLIREELGVHSNYPARSYGFSVRCLKN